MGFAIGATTKLAGGLMSAGGKIRQARQQGRIAKLNAFLAEQDAAASLAGSVQGAKQSARDAKVAENETVADILARGGNSFDRVSELAAQSRLAIESILSQGKNQARSFMLQAKSERLQASLNQQAANMSAAGTMITSAGQFASTWSKFSTSFTNGMGWGASSTPRRI